MSATSCIIPPTPFESYSQPPLPSLRDCFIRVKVQTLAHTISKAIKSSSKEIPLIENVRKSHKKTEIIIQKDRSAELIQREFQIKILNRIIHSVKSIGKADNRSILDPLYLLRAYQVALLGDYTQALSDISAIAVQTSATLTLKQHVAALANPLQTTPWEMRASEFFKRSYNPSVGKVTLDFEIGDFCIQDVEALWIVNQPMCEHVLNRLALLWTECWNTAAKINSLGKDLTVMLNELRALAASELIAKNNNLIALYALGSCLSRDILNENGIPLSHIYYKEAGEKGFVIGLHAYAGVIFAGHNCPRDQQGGAIYYQMAAAQGFAPALRILGNCYLHGEGVLQNIQHGIDLLTTSIERGNEKAISLLGNWYDSLDDKNRAKWMNYIQEGLTRKGLNSPLIDSTGFVDRFK